MRQLITLLAVLLWLSPVLQGQQRVTIVAKGETFIESVLPKEMMYSFEEFRDAKLIRIDGLENETKININLFTGDILFLSPGNQILVMAYPKEVSRIMMGSSLWVPVEETFGEVIFSKDDISLVRVKKTRITDTRRETAFGGMSSTVSTKSVTAFAADNRGHVAIPVGEYDFETATTYRLSDGSRMVIADAKGFRRIFSKNRKELNNFIKTNRIDFKDESDLLNLVKKSISF